jgi:transposase
MLYLKDIEKTVNNKRVFCGIDFHKNNWNLCFICNGEIVEQIHMPAQYHRLHHHLRTHYQSARHIRLVYEAGYFGFWLYRKLRADGFDCIVTSPNRMPVVNQKLKTDKRDARKLAQFLSVGLLKSIYIPPLDLEADRSILRLRTQLVHKSNRVKAQIKSLLQLTGIQRPKYIKSCWTKRYIVWLKEIPFPEQAHRFTLDMLLLDYQALEKQIDKVNQTIREMAGKEPYRKPYKRLTACPGIGLITAMTFLVECHPVSRFHNSKRLASYLGLTPGQKSSGEHVRLGHITQEGNNYVRRVLIESAWTVIRHDPHLRNKYRRITAKGQNGKKAIVAVARSLAIRMRRCLIEEKPYCVGIC